MIPYRAGRSSAECTATKFSVGISRWVFPQAFTCIDRIARSEVFRVVIDSGLSTNRDQEARDSRLGFNATEDCILHIFQGRQAPFHLSSVSRYILLGVSGLKTSRRSSAASLEPVMTVKRGMPSDHLGSLPHYEQPQLLCICLPSYHILVLYRVIMGG